MNITKLKKFLIATTMGVIIMGGSAFAGQNNVGYRLVNPKGAGWSGPSAPQTKSMNYRDGYVYMNSSTDNRRAAFKMFDNGGTSDWVWPGQNAMLPAKNIPKYTEVYMRSYTPRRDSILFGTTVRGYWRSDY